MTDQKFLGKKVSATYRKKVLFHTLSTNLLFLFVRSGSVKTVKRVPSPSDVSVISNMKCLGMSLCHTHLGRYKLSAKDDVASTLLK